MPTTLAAYTPTPAISIDGASTDALGELITAVTVKETIDGLAHCEIKLDNWGVVGDGPGYIFSDRASLDFGMSVEIEMGPPDEQVTVFAGKVTGIEAEYGMVGGPRVVVLAEDPLQDLRMTRRTRTFDELSDADIVSAIASDHGLTPSVDIDGPSHAVICQLNQSDLAFLRERALPHAADVWVEGQTLHVGERDEETLVLRFGQELLEFQVLADIALQATEQRVTGWDSDNKEEIIESADESSISGDIGAGIGGGKLLSEAFGDRPATAPLPGAVTSAEARALATAMYRQRARRFVTGSGTADGLASLRAGRQVELAGLGAVFDGDYRLSQVIHHYSLEGGYRTEIEVERSEIPQ